MGRHKTIDREALLDAAEHIVQSRGASALTIDAVARAAGITKGGVQYSFKNKDALIDAMFERSGQSYDRAFHEFAGPSPDAMAMARAHIEATRVSDAAAGAKAASLLAALQQTPEHLVSIQQWYQKRFACLDPTTEEGRQARVTFLATEGAFLLRFFGLMAFEEQEWHAALKDIAALLPASKTPGPSIDPDPACEHETCKNQNL